MGEWDFVARALQGIEKGFTLICVNPWYFLERKTGFGPATPTLSRIGLLFTKFTRIACILRAPERTQTFSASNGDKVLKKC
jgi:hypothetical protein